MAVRFAFSFQSKTQGKLLCHCPVTQLVAVRWHCQQQAGALTCFCFRGTTSRKSSTLNHTTGHGIIPCFLQWSASNKRGNRKTVQTLCNPASAYSPTVSMNLQVRDSSKSSRALLAMHTGNQCTGQCTLLTCFTAVNPGCNVTPRQLDSSPSTTSILALKPPKRLSGLCCAAAPSLSPMTLQAHLLSWHGAGMQPGTAGFLPLLGVKIVSKLENP